jgi:hypothetical protein
VVVDDDPALAPIVTIIAIVAGANVDASTLNSTALAAVIVPPSAISAAIARVRRFAVHLLWTVFLTDQKGQAAIRSVSRRI